MSDGIKKVEDVKKDEPKVAYHFNIVRRTGEDEQINVQFNGYEGETVEKLQERVELVAQVLYNRVETNNKKMLEIQSKMKGSQVENLLAGGKKFVPPSKPLKSVLPAPVQVDDKKDA